MESSDHLHAVASSPHAGGSLRPIFVGRDREVNKVCNFLNGLQLGRSATILLAGEAGTGKSSLLTHALHIAAEQHATMCAIGTCTLTLGRPEPYWPFREVFRSVILQSFRNAHSSHDLEQAILSQLLISLPELSSVLRPDLAIGVDRFHELTSRLGLPPIHDIDRTRDISQADIFNQFIKFLSFLSAHRPLVIAVDNLHWADDTSLDLFCHIGHALPERLVLIGTYRTEAVAGEQGRSALRHAFNELRRQGATLISLDDGTKNTLGSVESFTDQYLAASFPNNTFPHSFCTRLALHTGGNPLFIGELLTYAAHQGHIVEDKGCWTISPAWEAFDLPESLEAIIEERLQQLTETLKETLTYASVQGHDFTAEVLASVQGEDPDTVLSCLLDDLGKSHQLIAEKGEREISPNNLLSLFQFRNSLIQQRLYKELGVAQRRRLHKKVAECLETIYGEQRLIIASQLAFHFRMARDVEKALGYELEAAKQFGRQLAFKEAISSFRTARDLAAARTVQGDGLVWTITLDLADLLKRIGSLGDAIEEYSQIVKSSSPEASVRAWALNGIGDAYRLQGDYGGALRFYQQCEALSTEFQDRVLLIDIWSDFAHLYHRMANESALASNTVDAVAQRKLAEFYANKVVASAEIVGDWDHVRKGYMVLGNLGLDSGDLAGAERNYQQAAVIAEKNNLAMVAYHGLGDICRFRGNYKDALSYYEQFKRWAIKNGVQRSEMIAHNDIGLAYVAAGDFPAAKECFERSMAMNDPIRRRMTAVVSAAMLGFISEHDGDHVGAMRLYSEAVHLSKQGNISTCEYCDAKNAAAKILVAYGEYRGALLLVSDHGRDDAVAIALEEECRHYLTHE